MRRRAAGLDGGGRVQLQRPEGQVDPVAAEVAHRAVAEIPPAIPLGPGQVDVVERPRRRRTEPQVPVDAGGNGVHGLGAVLHEHDVLELLGLGLGGVPAPGARHPDVALADRADGAGLHELDDAAVVVAGVDLRAHLRDDAGLRGGLADDARLLDVVGERLLAVDVLLQLERGQRGEGVRVLGGADDARRRTRRDDRRCGGSRLPCAPADTGRRPCRAPCGRRRRGRRCAREATPFRLARAAAADADHGDAELVPGLRAEDGGAGGPGRGSDGAGRLDESSSCGSNVACHTA